jgi:hypothetical protein
MRQKKALEETVKNLREEQDHSSKACENWWPDIGRWTIGMVMDGASIKCPEGEFRRNQTCDRRGIIVYKESNTI